MAHNIEINNGVASFVENGRKERAWHRLGQVFDGPMTVHEALTLSHADYKVTLQPVCALSDDIMKKLESGEMINPDDLLGLIVQDRRATVRTDKMRSLGVVTDKYGVVQNEDAFRFIDTLCTGKLTDNNDTPVIETAGVLGRGERVFITAKFPEPIILDNKGNDIVEMYIVFTTSHDGTGAVNCLVTPTRVVCNNTLNLAMNNCVGRLSFRHSSQVMKRIDLTDKENASLAFKTLNMYDVYKKSLDGGFTYLNQIRLTSQQVDDIVAETFLTDENFKVYKEAGRIDHEDIPTRSQNLFKRVRDTIESGIGQELMEAGTANWLIQGITCYNQNVAFYNSEDYKFKSLMEGVGYQKLQKAYKLATAV